MERELEMTPWPSEWMRGVMELCVLRAIAEGPTYGYAIAVTLDLHGLGAPKGGTLYPLLARCEQAQWVRSYWGAGEGGPGRKFYELTAAGRTRLAEMTQVWGRFSGSVSAYLNDFGRSLIDDQDNASELVSPVGGHDGSTRKGD